jgi:hypothetical protein
MPQSKAVSKRVFPSLLLGAVALVAFACGDRVDPTGVIAKGEPPVLQAFACTASTAARSISCETTTPPPASTLRLDQKVFGNQGLYVRLKSANAAYNTTTNIFSFTLTAQNLTTTMFSTADGVTRDAAGVRVVFSAPPVGSPSGIITVANPTGQATYTSPNQDYFQYGGQIGGVDQIDLGGDGILQTAEVSGSKTWQLNVPNTVQTFSFVLYVAAQTPAGALSTAAPQIDSIKPATLVRGGTATVFGRNFALVPASNTINVDGLPSVGLPGAAAGQLNFVVPCGGFAAASLNVTGNSMTAMSTATALVNVTANSMTGVSVHMPIEAIIVFFDQAPTAAADLCNIAA